MNGTRKASWDELRVLERARSSSDTSYGASGSRWWAAQSSCTAAALSGRERYGVGAGGRLFALASAQPALDGGVADHAAVGLVTKTAIDTVLQSFDATRLESAGPLEVRRRQLSRQLRAVILSAHAAARARAGRSGGSVDLALMVVAIDDARIAVARVGSTSAFRLRGAVLAPLGWLAPRSERGGAEGELVPRGATLREPVIAVHEVREGDTYVFSSDGVGGALSEEEIREQLTLSALPMGACDALVRAAHRRNPSRVATAIVLTLHPEITTISKGFGSRHHHRVGAGASAREGVAG